MTRETVSTALDILQQKAAGAAANVLAYNAERVDRLAEWPEASLRELAGLGLMGLHIPRRLGGHGEGLLALALVTEELARGCSSTAMCYGMHCVGSKVLAVKATPWQEEHYLVPIAEGRHITTLALSEPTTGVHFYLPRTVFSPEPVDRDPDDEEAAEEAPETYLVNGQKSFVTNGSHADSYVISVIPPGGEMDPGTFTCLILDADTSGLEWQDSWQGLGMRGNSSRAVRLSQARVPASNVLGSEGDQIWYAFEIVAPYFLVAMTGVYLGIAHAALDFTIKHLQGRRYEHTGRTLDTIPVLEAEVARMWTAVERCRQLLHHAARLGDAGHPDANRAIFASKMEVANCVREVTHTSVELCGGRAYQQNALIGRLLRDSQAAHVMSPTRGLLESWVGRSVLGLPVI